MLHRPGVGFVDRGPADCNIGANKQPLQWWVVGSGDQVFGHQLMIGKQSKLKIG